MTDGEENHVPGGLDERRRSASQVIGPDSLSPILELLEDVESDAEKFEAEQKLIASILERHNGEAELLTIAEDMGAQPHEIEVPIDLMHQSGVVDISGSGIQLTVSLTD